MGHILSQCNYLYNIYWGSLGVPFLTERKIRQMKEIWKTLDISNKYKISNYGNIINRNTNKKVTPIVEGRGAVVYLYDKNTFTNNKRGKKRASIPQLVMRNFSKNYRENYYNNPLFHLDGNRLNNKLDNLSYKPVSQLVSEATILDKIKERNSNWKFFDNPTNRRDIVLARHSCGRYTAKRAGTWLLEGICFGCNNDFSSGEVLVDNILSSLGVTYANQYPITINGKGQYSLDFVILSKDFEVIAAIEYQGEQHASNYNKHSLFYDPKQVYRDALKKEYLKNKGIPLLQLFPDDNIYMKKIIGNFVNNLPE